ncbi:MAG: BON domain-containing protein [Chloroflexi bacterium]|nr:BON domain-containing protein [Chloroflexota bacterium]
MTVPFSADHRPDPAVPTTKHDEELVQRVNEALTADDRTRNEIIEVYGAEGRVTLSGEVHSPEAKRAAELIARDVCGRENVLNHLTVS